MPSIHEQLLAAAVPISPRLHDAIAANGAVRLERSAPDLPLTVRLCRTVAGQQLSVTAAQTIWNRLLVQSEGRPLVEHLRASTLDALRTAGLSMAKAKTMKAIADADIGGKLDVAALAALGHEQRADQLTAIWGVGAWTADIVGIFHFGDRDIWPDGDVTARKTLIRLTSARRKTTLTAARFSPYRSYLALHMWHAANAAPQ